MAARNDGWAELKTLRPLWSQPQQESVATLYVDDSARDSKAAEMLLLWTETKPVRVEMARAPHHSSAPYLSLREDKDRIVVDLFGSNGSLLTQEAIPRSKRAWSEALQSAVMRLAAASSGK